MREPDDDDEQPVTGEQDEPGEPQDITMSGGVSLPKLGAGSGE